MHDAKMWCSLFPMEALFTQLCLYISNKHQRKIPYPFTINEICVNNDVFNESVNLRVYDKAPMINSSIKARIITIQS